MTILRGDLGRPNSGNDAQNHAYVLRLGYLGRFSDKLGLRVVFPYTRSEFPSTDFSAESVGNIYVGILFLRQDSPLLVELGAHLPTAPDFFDGTSQSAAAISGFIVDYVEHAESFYGAALPISAWLRNPDFLPGPLRGGFDAGAHLWFPTGDANDTEFALDFGLLFGYDGGVILPALEIRGRLGLSGEGGASENDAYEARASLGGRFGIVHPALEVRVPLNDYLSDWVDLVYGLRVSLDLR